MYKVLGVSALNILVPDSRLAELKMQEAHDQDHKGAKITLWRSRADVWIWKGMKLAEKVEKACVRCIARKAALREQRMGNLPDERISPGTPPFTAICLDLLGPVTVKAMVNKRATMKVWPILMVCQGTGAVHTQLCHDYGTQAFLLQWENFVALRGTPSLVVSDRGSQLTSATNYVTWAKKEDPSKWDWDSVSSKGSTQGTEWRFVPAGCQYRNGLAESKVKALKSTLNHMMTSTIISKKPTLSYAELFVLLSRAASIVNDRPIGVRGLTEDDFQPLTPNMLLLGRSGGSSLPIAETQEENYRGASKYHEELLDVWWKQWRVQVFPHLLPYHSFKEAKRHKNLRRGDICLLLYEGKIRGTYKLCRVLETIVSDDGLVRMVKVGFPKQGGRVKVHPKSKCVVDVGDKDDYPLLDQLVVGVPRLVLITPVEDATAT